MTRLAQFGVGTRNYAGFVAKTTAAVVVEEATRAGGGPRVIRTIRAPRGTPARRREEELAIIAALEAELEQAVPIVKPLIKHIPDEEAALVMLLL